MHSSSVSSVIASNGTSAHNGEAAGLPTFVYICFLMQARNEEKTEGVFMFFPNFHPICKYFPPTKSTTKYDINLVNCFFLNVWRKPKYITDLGLILCLLWWRIKRQRRKMETVSGPGWRSPYQYPDQVRTWSVMFIFCGGSEAVSLFYLDPVVGSDTFYGFKRFDHYSL